jgi:hypothetical protein
MTEELGGVRQALQLFEIEKQTMITECERKCSGLSSKLSEFQSLSESAEETRQLLATRDRFITAIYELFIYNCGFITAIYGLFVYTYI